MAIRETAKAQVYLDGKQAEAAIDSLKAKSKELRKAMNDARKAGNFDEYRKLEKEVKQIDTATASLTKSTFDYQTVLKNINGASFNELNKALRTVTSEMRRMKRTDAGYKEKEIQVKRLRSEIASLNNNTRATTSLWSKFSNGVNQNLTAVSAIIATVSGAAFGVHEFIKGLTGLDDSLANVMKTTGMARKEVRELYSEFNKLNTRTSKSVLLEYAEEAGRLGKQSKADVLEFVDVANKIGTALGDDLGNAPEAIREVGKLVGVFGIGEQYGVGFGESMEKVGSAINEIAANSAADAPFQIDFLKRLSGIAKQANITVDNILGYSSVLNQAGKTTEKTATAMSKLIVDMFAMPDKFASIAGMEVKEFSTLLEKDANEAFLSFLKGINGNNEGLSSMTQKLKELGINAEGEISTITTLAAKIKDVRKEQALANKAMLEGTSLTNEYNIKNNNLAGSWEKIQKKMKSIFVNTGLIEKFEGTITALATSIENGSFDKYVRTFKNLTLATIAYVTVQKIAYNWDKLTYALRKSRVVTLAFFNGKMNLLTKATEAQTKAQKANNAALKANLWAFVASAIVFTIQKLIQYNKEAIKADRTHKQYIESLVEEQGKANDLFNTYKKLNPESEEAKRIKDKLVKLYPDLMSKYVTEKGLIEDIAKAQKDVNDEILRTVALRSKESEIEELGAKTFKKKKEAYESLLDFSENASEKASLSSMLGDWENEMANENATPDEITDKIASFLDIQKMGNITTTSPTTGASFTKISDYNKIRGKVFELFNANKQFENTKKEVDSFYSFLKDVTTTTEEDSNLEKTKTIQNTSVESKQDSTLDKEHQQKINAQKERFASQLDNEKEHKLKLLNIDLWYLKEKEKLAKGLDQLKLQGQILDNELEISVLSNEKENDDAADLLKKYETYEQAKTRIESEWKNERKKLKEAGAEQGNFDKLEEVYQAQLDELEEKAKKVTSNIAKLFADMSGKSASELHKLADEGKAMLEYLSSGKYESGAFGISKEDFERISSSPEALAKVSEQVHTLRHEANMSETALRKMVQGFNAIADGDILGGLNLIQQGVAGVTKAVDMLSNCLEVIGTATGSEALTSISQGLKDVMDVANQTMEGAMAGMQLAGPIGGIIGAGVGLLTGVLDKLNASHDKKKEREIQRIQERIDALQNSYDSLSKSIERAYSVDASKLIEQQDKLLKQQNVELQKQIEAEKGKKDADQGRIDALQAQIDANLKTLVESPEAKIDVVLGTSYKSDLEAFSSAYVNAFVAGEDRAKAQKDVVKNMLKSMATELMNKNLGELVTKLREQMYNAMEDGVITDAEVDAFNKTKDAIYRKSEEQADMLEKLNIIDDSTTAQSA